MTHDAGLRTLLRHAALLGKEIVLGMLEASLRATHHHRIADAIPEFLSEAQAAGIIAPIRASGLLSVIHDRTDLATNFADPEQICTFANGWQSDDERIAATLGATSWLSALWPASPKGDESTSLLEEIVRLHLAASRPGQPSVDAWRFGRAVAERQLARGDVKSARATASALLATLATTRLSTEDLAKDALARIEKKSGTTVACWFANLISDIAMILADAAQCAPPDWDLLDRVALIGLTAEDWMRGASQRQGERSGPDPLRRAHLLNRRGIASRARGALEPSVAHANVLFTMAETYHRDAVRAITGRDWRADVAYASTTANQCSLMIERALKNAEPAKRLQALNAALSHFDEAQKRLDRPQLVEARIAMLNDAAWTAGQLAGNDAHSQFGPRSDALWAHALELARKIPNLRVGLKWQQRILKNRGAARISRGAAGGTEDSLASQAISASISDPVQLASADAPYLAWHERGTVPAPAFVGLSGGHFDRHRELLVLLIDMEHELRRFIDRVHCKYEGDRWLQALADRDPGVRTAVEEWLGRSTIVAWDGSAPDVLANAYIRDYWRLIDGASWCRFAPWLDGRRRAHWAWMLGGSILPRVRNATAHAKYADLEKWEVVAVEASALELIFRIRQNP